MNRRLFLLSAISAIIEPHDVLWVPGRRTISIPSTVAYNRRNTGKTLLQVWADGRVIAEHEVTGVTIQVGQVILENAIRKVCYELCREESVDLLRGRPIGAIKGFLGSADFG